MQYTDLKVKIKDKEHVFNIPTWDMNKQIQNQNKVLPLVSSPISNAVAMMGEEDNDESMFMAAVIKGVLDALSSEEFPKAIPALLSDVGYFNANGVAQSGLTVDKLQDLGGNLSTLYTICIAVIKENYGPLLQGGLQDSLLSIVG